MTAHDVLAARLDGIPPTGDAAVFMTRTELAALVEEHAVLRGHHTELFFDAHEATLAVDRWRHSVDGWRQAMADLIEAVRCVAAGDAGPGEWDTAERALDFAASLLAHPSTGAPR